MVKTKLSNAQMDMQTTVHGVRGPMQVLLT